MRSGDKQAETLAMCQEIQALFPRMPLLYLHCNRRCWPQDDGLHLTTAAQARLGTMLASAAAGLATACAAGPAAGPVACEPSSAPAPA